MLLTELNQQLIYGYPVPTGKDFHQGIFALFRGGRVDPTQAVGNAMYMGIHADGVNVETEVQYQVGGFSAHTG
jgi:hypothetical protein